MFCAASDPVIERQPCGLAGLVISDRSPRPDSPAGFLGPALLIIAAMIA
jgi:hypothetical protein